MPGEYILHTNRLLSSVQVVGRETSYVDSFVEYAAGEETPFKIMEPQAAFKLVCSATLLDATTLRQKPELLETFSVKGMTFWHEKAFWAEVHSRQPSGLGTASDREVQICSPRGSSVAE